jgi:hypothetical protein
MSFLDQEFSLQNIRSYARACKSIQETIELLGQDRYNHIVIPSRGASPLVNGAETYWSGARSLGYDRQERANHRLEWQNSPFRRSLMLPFTSDVGTEITGISPRMIRKYWTRVLAAIVRGDKRDPHWIMYDYIRKNVCRIPDFSYVEERCRNPRFVFIDTVVSGQAICEIVEAMDDSGLSECYYILVIDENGTKLKSKYRQIIEGLEQSDRATLIKVNRLFTEDRGPALTGIWGAVMPELMQVAIEEISTFSRSSAVGAGVAYVEVKRRDDDSNLAVTVANSQLHTIMYSALNEQITDDNIEYQLTRYKEHLHEARLLDYDTTRDVARSVIERFTPSLGKLDVSNSHVIRIGLGIDRAAAIIRMIKNDHSL